MSPKKPKWREVADHFANEIAEGKYRPGDQLPMIRELVAQGHGSKTTVMAAYSALEAEGLVTTTRGHGTTVRRRPPQQIRRHQDRYNWEKQLAKRGDGERRNNGVVEKDTGLDHDEVECHAAFNAVPADQEVAARFGVEPGTLMLHRHYWHSTPGSPIALSLINSYLVHAVAARNPDLLDSSREPWPGGTHHQLSTIGIEIAEIEDGIRTRLAAPDEARHLGIPAGSPVLLLDKTSRSTAGEVVEYSHVVLPGDRTEFRYTVPLDRWED
ncbi:GntR family transcriptional regulator [Kitasatospora cathayae]|uniref:GntR family transcriptional regulator n=1 Tax=Kitasatospora cathayae TaxID=3004092 RepID=A0ABY7QHB9_9ACTN|nr:GntR family transcriptional regulator [Kitasatospora sp. HUAS 3-15]WBP92183.1 GntR family transcriptional regulator [Kitasatospora sp. HUAS 3-15]